MKGQYQFPTTTGAELLYDNGKWKSGRRARRFLSRPAASFNSKSRAVEVDTVQPFLLKKIGGMPSGATDFET
jgi:hypothetical protein